MVIGGGEVAAGEGGEEGVARLGPGGSGVDRQRGGVDRNRERGRWRGGGERWRRPLFLLLLHVLGRLGLGGPGECRAGRARVWGRPGRGRERERGRGCHGARRVSYSGEP